MFDSVVAVAFQIAFRAEIHANNVFYFLKIIFDINTLKRFKKYKLHSILTKKNWILWERGLHRFPKHPLSMEEHINQFRDLCLDSWDFD